MKERTLTETAQRAVNRSPRIWAMIRDTRRNALVTAGPKPSPKRSFMRRMFAAAQRGA